MTVRSFQKHIWRWFAQHGRQQLPWRQTADPYHILVSEMMLQQTQVDRVIPKYQAFIKRFPTVQHLARAQQRSVIGLWQGLGYNRRAMFLHRAAKAIVQEYAGQWPQTPAALAELPGVGQYTAAAVCAFAFNQPVAMIETNIRRVFIHHFFADRDGVTDAELLPLIEQALDTTDPRQWYWALMDYGAIALKDRPNPNRQSAHYTKQSSFVGSARQVRGQIVKTLTEQRQLTVPQLLKALQFPAARVKQQLAALEAEGFVRQQGTTIRLR